jgi:peptidoglycan/xylan/chitin deacetylase (PgdA/CDA1 family)
MKLFKPPRFAKWIFPRYTWRFSVYDHSIFLTFDDGPHPDITPFVLDLLKSYEWKATFFCVGENIQKYPEITKRILSEGHRIGNHTQKHSHAYRVSSKSYLNSFHAFESNYQTTIFRPPYGRLKPSLAKQIAKTHQIILWSWLSYDYDLDVSNATILQQARAVKPGNIIVLHDNPKIVQRQKQLLPALFEMWKNEGLFSKTIPL